MMHAAWPRYWGSTRSSCVVRRRHVQRSVRLNIAPVLFGNATIGENEALHLGLETAGF